MRNKLILIVLLDSGIRCHELIDIKLSDISNNAIKIFGKGKKERFVPITPTIYKYLLKYLRMRENYLLDKYQLDKEYLFASFFGFADVFLRTSAWHRRPLRTNGNCNRRRRCPMSRIRKE